MNKFTVRFYSVEKTSPQGLPLGDVLRQVASESNFLKRTRQLTAGLAVRLERYSEDAGDLLGEFTRVTTSDFPFEVADDGVHPLQTDGPIGRGAAFRYRPADHTLAMQYDTRIVSPGRAMEYLSQCDDRAGFIIRPKVDEDNWRKFRDSSLRKLRISIASPQHMAEIEDEGAPVSRSFKEFGEAYDAPVITIELGMGNRKGMLADVTKIVAEKFFEKFMEDSIDLRSLKASVKAQDDIPTEDVNLIDEVLSDRFEIELPANDPDRSFQMRDNFLKSLLADHG